MNDSEQTQPTTEPLLAQIAALEATVRRHEIALLQSVDQLAKVAQLEAQLAEAKKALEGLLNECSEAGLADARDFGWPKVIAASRAAIDAAIAQELRNVGAKLPHAEQPAPERAEASRVGST